jgi:hypothetical protein
MAKKPNLRITAAKGLEEVLKKIGKEGAKKLTEELDGITEIHALKAINEAKENAPRRDGFLKNSIHLYGRQMKLSRLFGSDRPYATRQEYEHATKKGFFRKAMWNRREPYRKDIQDAIKRLDD